MKKPSIRSLTLRNLINVLLTLSILLLATTAFNFRTLSTLAIENQALAHAELVKAGLTAHMKAGMMDKSDYYLAEIKDLTHVRSLRILRGDAVNKQFGPGKAWQRNPANTRNIPDSPLIMVNEWTWDPTIRVIVPYTASQQGNLNCLGCHDVSEGTVLGGVDMEISVGEYRNYALWGLFSMLAMMILALLLIYLNTSRTIRHHVQQPLETLIDNAMLAYQQRTPVAIEQFKTREFSHVAHEFNQFNSEILAHQELLKQKNQQLLSLNDEIESTLRETVYTMGVIEEKRSQETGNHTRRVGLYCQLLARKLGLSEQDVDLVTAASPLHDIGKLGIPDHILHKPGKLTDEERSIMKNHPLIGYAMLQHSQRDILQAAGIIAHQHHEKWNGAGYPQGLAGENIHIFARIVAIADVFDALYSPRVYKSAWPLEKIRDYFDEQTGKHFDPQLMAIFLRDLDEFAAIYHQHPADSPN